MSKKIIAVVGAGGKTTYIKKKAKEYVTQGMKVFVTTTTHMRKEADTIVTDEADEIIKELQEKSYVMAGRDCGEKIQALSEETYEKVCEYADIVLVEADGSKHMPIKFPAKHEPVIPPNATQIVVISGLYALGKPLYEVAHRLELVKECLNKEGAITRKNRSVDDKTIVEAHHIQKLVMKGYLEPMREAYPEIKISVKVTHDESLYQRVIAKLIEAEIDVSVIKKEWFQTQPELFICGGGHVSCELVKMAACLDFNVKVMDDREEFANPRRFPLASEVICDSFENLGKYLVKDGYYAVVTRGHKDDLNCVRTILKHPYQYLGMIGSKSKIKTTYENLKNEGVTQEELDTIYAPIGLNIGARTPAEIAVSILCEIIQVKNAKTTSFISRELAGIQKKGTLCIIIEKTGSSPRGEGSMMFVTDTDTIDTIGGGAVEYAAIEDARANKEGVFIKDYCLSNRTAENLGMICGGENKVLFVPL